MRRHMRGRKQRLSRCAPVLVSVLRSALSVLGVIRTMCLVRHEQFGLLSIVCDASIDCALCGVSAAHLSCGGGM